MRVIGHRGASGEAPENTLGGFQYALGKGVQHFELDVRLSGDGEPVVIHDASAWRTTGVRCRINRTPVAQLARLNAAQACSWPIEEGVPSLHALLPVLTRCRSVQLEIKTDKPQRQARLLSAIGTMLASIQHDQFQLTSFQPSLLRQARELVPGISRGLLCERRFANPLAVARRLGCRSIIFHCRLAQQHMVSRAKALGLEVYTYTSNDPEAIRSYRDWGLDGVITDYPVRFLDLQDGLAPVSRLKPS